MSDTPPGPDTGILQSFEKGDTPESRAAALDAGSTLALAALDRARSDSKASDAPETVTKRAKVYLDWLKEQNT